MLNEFSRTQLLLGEAAMLKLQNAKVAIFGIGGVGSYAAEAIARSGVGTLVLFDNDTVSLTNLNRQLIATHQSLGRLKVEVMQERILDINPKAQVKIQPIFYTKENAANFDFRGFSYIIDAIDTVSAKIALIQQAFQANVPIISSMGAGNKLDPTQFEVSDIYKTSVCPLARVMRKELKKLGIPKLQVVYSKEQPLTPLTQPQDTKEAVGKRQTPGSISFVPSVAGLIIAGEVIKAIAKA